ncbi:MAG: hypothetical protein QW767_03640 [Thermoprotei archaeon]
MSFVIVLIEAIFNREFLASVLPLGTAGVNISQVSPMITAFYYIGGYAFGIMTLLVPATLIFVAILGVGEGASARTVMYLGALAAFVSVVMDLEHVGAGVSNIFQNTSPLESLLLLSSVFASVALSACLVFKRAYRVALPVGAMLFTELLGLLFLIGNIITANFKVPFGTQAGAFAAELEPYVAAVAGFAFTLMGAAIILKKKTAWRTVYLACLVLGALIEYLIMTNILHGSSIVLGTIIIYVFGFLGVTNAFVSVIVFSAITSFITACFLFGLGRNHDIVEEYAGLIGLLLIVTGFVYASETVTTYILMPALCSSAAGIWIVKRMPSHIKPSALAG